MRKSFQQHPNTSITQNSILQWVVVFLLVTVFCFSCSPTIDKYTPLTTFDFQTRDSERLRLKIERLVGTDSAGLAAMQYIKDYETELENNFPAKRRMKSGLGRVGNYYGIPFGVVGHPTTPMSKSRDSIVDNTAAMRFVSFLNRQRQNATVELQRNCDEFTTSGQSGWAKMALANAYVIVNSNPPSVQVQMVVEKIEPLLKVLQPSTQ